MIKINHLSVYIDSNNLDGSGDNAEKIWAHRFFGKQKTHAKGT